MVGLVVWFGKDSIRVRVFMWLDGKGMRLISINLCSLILYHYTLEANYQSGIGTKSGVYNDQVSVFASRKENGVEGIPLKEEACTLGEDGSFIGFGLDSKLIFYPHQDYS